MGTNLGFIRREGSAFGLPHPVDLDNYGRGIMQVSLLFLGWNDRTHLLLGLSSRWANSFYWKDIRYLDKGDGTG